MADTTTSSTTTQGSITISIEGKDYTLTGTVGDSVIVAYHETFSTGINLGPVKDIAPKIATALGATDVGTELISVTEDLTQVPFLGPIADLLLSANLRITDLGINTATNVYELGIALDFTSEPAAKRTLAGVELQSFGIKVTYTKPAA